MAQQVKVTGVKPDNLCLMPGTNMVNGELTSSKSCTSAHTIWLMYTHT